MRLNKYTQRAQEAIFDTQALAESFNHPQIEPEHLLLTLLHQEDGVVPQIVLSQGRNPTELQGRVEAELQRKPKVYGTATQVGVSAALQRVLQSAQAEADAMRDDYVSTEHLLLALAGKDGQNAQKLLAAQAYRRKRSCRPCCAATSARAAPSWPACATGRSSSTGRERMRSSMRS